MSRLHDPPAPDGSFRSVSRTRFLAGGLGVGAAATFGLLSGGRGPARAAGQPPKRTIHALQAALLIEYAEIAFFTEALSHGGLHGKLLHYVRTVLPQERDHRAALRKALGKQAQAPPKFDFGDRTRSASRVLATAVRLEDLAVEGYNGQATNLTAATLAAATSIVSVEARHAAWIRAIDGRESAPSPLDHPRTAGQVVAELHALGMKS